MSAVRGVVRHALRLGRVERNGIEACAEYDRIHFHTVSIPKPASAGSTQSGIITLHA